MQNNEINLKQYSSNKIVQHYNLLNTKFKPEDTIFNILKPKLAKMKMLDLGVGGGRTTVLFANQVLEYTAIDFSKGMIDSCKEKFKNIIPKANFILGDVRLALKEYPSKRFDFVLFSLNGIDYMNNQERTDLMIEIKRILIPNGYFCFSSHNIQCINEFTKIKIRLNLFKLIPVLLKHKKFIKKNKAEFELAKDKDYIIIHDDLYDFGLNIYYARPIFQIQKLKSLGFKTIRTFNFKEGNELSTHDEVSKHKEYFLYYLCQ
jgi:ubiquinone/menaquinone biosynthesis C-methylase UbiE